jgi:transcriptional regulator with XRE-family HTH domain
MKRLQNRKPINIQIGKIVKETRLIHNLSQAELAKRVETSRNIINNVEEGITRLSSQLAVKLENELGISLQEQSTFLEINTSGLKTNNLPEKSNDNDIENLVGWFAIFARRNLNLAQNLKILGIRMAEANDIGDPFLRNIADEWFDRTSTLYGGCAVGTINIIAIREVEIWKQLLEKANKSILATSCLQPSSWWGTPEGRLYQKTNIIKAQNMKIERIFVLQSIKEAKEIFSLIKEQINAGIKIWVGIIDRGFPPEKAHDFYILDEHYVGTLHLQNRSAIQLSIFSVSPLEVRRFTALFGDMKSFACKVTCESDLDMILNSED